MIHQDFEKQMNEVLARNRPLRNKLTSKLLQIRSNPNVGRRMKGVASPDLQGVIWRVQVGGRSGHRLIYIWLPHLNTVIPVLLSPEQKSKFSYRSSGWEECCAQLFEDFSGGRHEAFAVWQDTSESTP